ncbi:MAG: hypothetical protein MUF49_31470 [Oculatellaceae cyanobacterium Prado106]|jgi:hypothetical protein|nr:hypothetical protein [Oculatellaceae cyanobacterium Prado106]
MNLRVFGLLLILGTFTTTIAACSGPNQGGANVEERENEAQEGNNQIENEAEGQSEDGDDEANEKESREESGEKDNEESEEND